MPHLAVCRHYPYLSNSQHFGCRLKALRLMRVCHCAAAEGFALPPASLSDVLKCEVLELASQGNRINLPNLVRVNHFPKVWHTQSANQFAMSQKACLKYTIWPPMSRNRWDPGTWNVVAGATCTDISLGVPTCRLCLSSKLWMFPMFPYSRGTGGKPIELIWLSSWCISEVAQIHHVYMLSNHSLWPHWPHCLWNKARTRTVDPSSSSQNYAGQSSTGLCWLKPSFRGRHFQETPSVSLVCEASFQICAKFLNLSPINSNVPASARHQEQARGHGHVISTTLLSIRWTTDLPEETWISRGGPLLADLNASFRIWDCSEARIDCIREQTVATFSCTSPTDVTTPHNFGQENQVRNRTQFGSNVRLRSDSLQWKTRVLPIPSQKNGFRKWEMGHLWPLWGNNDDKLWDFGMPDFETIVATRNLTIGWLTVRPLFWARPEWLHQQISLRYPISLGLVPVTKWMSVNPCPPGTDVDDGCGSELLTLNVRSCPSRILVV